MMRPFEDLKKTVPMQNIDKFVDDLSTLEGMTELKMAEILVLLRKWLKK